MSLYRNRRQRSSAVAGDRDRYYTNNGVTFSDRSDRKFHVDRQGAVVKRNSSPGRSLVTEPVGKHILYYVMARRYAYVD